MERGGRPLAHLVRYRWYSNRSPGFQAQVRPFSALSHVKGCDKSILNHHAFFWVNGSTQTTPPTLVDLRIEVGSSFRGAQLCSRSFHVQSPIFSNNDPEPSSKIEETVNRLRQRQEGIPRIPILVPKHEESKELDKAPKKSLWIRFTDEVKHYYSGFKLLFLDVRICSKIIWKVLNGGTLTRRENKQLIRTVGDLFRLVPFSVFIIVPFMEFLLPVALKLFPGMLPSTFATSSEKENKMKRTLKAKLEYAKFLQKTLDEMGPSSGKSRDSKSARDFVEFYKKVKEQQIPVKNKDIKKFSQLFKDEITLDAMGRGQLVALCRLLELTPFGTDNFLRFQLDMKLRQLKIDDRMISKEGVENMNVEELQVANRERGMRALGLTEKMLEKQLGQWLDLSLNANIPPSLLLLSRTLYLPDTLDTTAQIAATISTLPESAAKRTSTAIGEQEGKIRNVARLEVIMEEQRKIDQEAAEEAERRKAEVEEETAKKVEKVITTDVLAETIPMQDVPSEHLISHSTGYIKKATVSDEGAIKEELVDKAEVLVDKAEELEAVVKKITSEDKKEVISSADLSDIKSAIQSLGKDEKDEMLVLGLKKELQDYEDDLEELKFVKAASGRSDLQESKGAKRLFGMVNRMLGKVDKLVHDLEEKERKIVAKIEEGQEKEENLVSVHELIEAVQKLQKTSDQSKVDQIADVSTSVQFI